MLDGAGNDHAETRVCVSCARPLTRHIGEKPSRFNKRIACNVSCVVQYARSRRRPTPTIPLTERAWRYIYPEPNCGCWFWGGAVTVAGYGYMTIAPRGAPHRNVMAHRLVYEMYKGPIPTGLDLDHLCRRPACVNPDHLEPVTRKENLRRGNGAAVTKARAAAITHCKNGHPFSGENLMIVASGYRRCRTCYDAYFSARKRGAPNV